MLSTSEKKVTLLQHSRSSCHHLQALQQLPVLSQVNPARIYRYFLPKGCWLISYIPNGWKLFRWDIFIMDLYLFRLQKISAILSKPSKLVKFQSACVSPFYCVTCTHIGTPTHRCVSDFLLWTGHWDRNSLYWSSPGRLRYNALCTKKWKERKRKNSKGNILGSIMSVKMLSVNATNPPWQKSSIFSRHSS